MSKKQNTRENSSEDERSEDKTQRGQSARQTFRTSETEPHTRGASRLRRDASERRGVIGGPFEGPPMYYGTMVLMNFSEGGSPHCETSASWAGRRFEPFRALRRSLS